MLSNQWLTEIIPASLLPARPAGNSRVAGFHEENQRGYPVTFVTPKNDREGERFYVPHDSKTEIVHCNNHIPPAPFPAMRALNRMRGAGFVLELDGPALTVSPADRLTEEQRRFIRAHKPALVQLLMDGAVLHEALVQAGPAGLGWMEGTPADWTGERLLAAGEVLYGNGRMVNRCERRYLAQHAPAFEWIEDAEAGEVAL